MTAAMPLKRNQPERVSVLVVEDEMLLAMLLEDSLADFGCDVVGPVGRVADGVRLANSERLDGAILDVNVGGTDVFPVARELAKRGIPFVFVSGYDSNHLPREWCNRPKLQKPFEPRSLAQCMARMFAGTK
jgi:DNA-binding response OmpR family regulator